MVTAAVIRKNEKVLLAQRPVSGLLGGMWEFPGGKQEPGESLKDCLRRELMEELGIGIEVGDSIGIFEHGYTHFRITLHAFMCKIIAGDPKPIQAEKIAWLRIDQMDDYPMGKVDRMIARSLDGG
jgi:A/G-specific adenine glycosylase